MKISSKITIDPVDYSSQGNAILGIIKSGKSYTATFLAEQLMEAGIPIVAFDPIGIWRHLKTGTNGHKGYPVVVAGGMNGDLPLTPESAPDIMRAAMREKVSLVLDLYSMELSKADWKRIVESCIRILLYENTQYGLRHIFIEEAAEFVPQKIAPDGGRVYAEIEKLARMGGNASLGYTLINQRPQEINKAVLELCSYLFLHKQKGRHSIDALSKWLDVTDTDNADEIISSLPGLSQGECWVWLDGNPVHVNKIPAKKTFHPDRKKPMLAPSTGITADVSLFVQNMKAHLEETEKNKEKEETDGGKKLTRKERQNIKNKLSTQNIQLGAISHKTLKMPTESNGTETAALKQENETLRAQLAQEKQLRQQAESKLKTVQELLAPQYEQLKKIFEAIGANGSSVTVDAGNYQIWLDKFEGKQRKMLEVLIANRTLTRPRWCHLSGVSYTSSGFDTAVRKFTSLKLVKKEGKNFILEEI